MWTCQQIMKIELKTDTTYQTNGNWLSRLRYIEVVLHPVRVICDSRCVRYTTTFVWTFAALDETRGGYLLLMHHVLDYYTLIRLFSGLYSWYPYKIVLGFISLYDFFAGLYPHSTVLGFIFLYDCSHVYKDGKQVSVKKIPHALYPASASCRHNEFFFCIRRCVCCLAWPVRLYYFLG